MRSLLAVGIKLVECVKSIFSDPICEKCLVLERWLESEREERAVITNILLKQGGMFDKEETKIDLGDFQSISRNRTLSSIRLDLEAQARAKNSRPKATEEELSEAEKKFEDSLNKANNAVSTD